MDWGDDFCLEYHFQPSGEHEEVCGIGDTIVIFDRVKDPIQVDRTLDGKRSDRPVKQGDIIIIPANIAHQSSWQGDSQFIMLTFNHEFFARAIDRSKKVQLIPNFATSDPLILQIGIAFKKALQNNTYSRLYIDTMANALFVHLMQYYSSIEPILKEYNDGLSRRKLQLVIDYIQANLERDLSLEELANLVGMSPCYFSKLFKQSTGITPHKYVIRARIEGAKKLLIQGKMSIADIAQTVGFAHQSHLNLHFKRLVGVTPKQFSQNS